MSVTKELIEQERQLVQLGKLRDVHLHREGSFLRGYDWSAWLCCRYLHDFKVNKRQVKGIDEPVAFSADVGAGPVPVRRQCRGRPCASPMPRKGHCHPLFHRDYLPFGQSGWHGACPYIGGEHW